MNRIKSIESFLEEVGGGFSFEYMEAYPFNHWKQDCEWLIALVDLLENVTVFIPIQALTAREACSKAFNKYNDQREDDEYDDEQ